MRSGRRCWSGGCAAFCREGGIARREASRPRSLPSGYLLFYWVSYGERYDRCHCLGVARVVEVPSRLVVAAEIEISGIAPSFVVVEAEAAGPMIAAVGMAAVRWRLRQMPGLHGPCGRCECGGGRRGL